MNIHYGFWRWLARRRLTRAIKIVSSFKVPYCCELDRKALNLVAETENNLRAARHLLRH